MNENIHQPMATYRLQFNQDFQFSDAKALVPYFSRLGVTHLYASPVLKARQESTHGYDVVDPQTLNPNLGDKTDLIDLTSDLHNFGLGLILDIVPNHMAASIENPYWRDVLTYGPSSPFAGWFDIDWRMPEPEMWGRVLAPVLGEPRARVLEKDQIQLQWFDGRFLVQYFDHLFPVDPATVPAICAFGQDDLKQRISAEHPALERIQQILDQLKTLPKISTRLRKGVSIDREETEYLLSQFAQVVVQSPQIEAWAAQTASRFGQGEAGRKRLKGLLDRQPYRLVNWRDAARTINYRRFFDINELISVRQEDPQVFDETHATVLRWIDDGLVDGLRIDHIDGLRDPRAYLERLADSITGGERADGSRPLFVEKILADNEKLPCGWPAAGTTGYEFLNQAESLFVSPEGFAEIEQQYRRLLRRPVQFEEFALWGKRRVLQNDLSPQVGRLADRLLRLLTECRQSESAFAAEQPPSSSGNSVTDLSAISHHFVPSKRDLVEAIVEVIVALPVYRTYVDSHHCLLSDADRHYVEAALSGAHAGGRAAPEAIDLLGDVLLLENSAQLPDHELHERVNFIQRFQQLTGPAAAKGIEDTAIYSYVPLVSLNEVGGEPHLPKNAVAAFHRANEERAAMWPQSMLCVTTHDTKRSADVRARLDVLSELPTFWGGVVQRWQRIHEPLCTTVGGKRAPDAAAEYLFYQTVIGIWPAPRPDALDERPASEVRMELRQRVEAYMVKAVREAKSYTSWTRKNEKYEQAVLSFVARVMGRDDNCESPFAADVNNLVARIARPGFWNSMSRTLLQLTSPGTPDLYQGDELWNFALVDPDNRRPVDYERRQKLLDEVVTATERPDESQRDYLRKLLETPEDGRVKLHLCHCALSARRDNPSLFANGMYLPLAVSGAAKDHLVAYARVVASKGNTAEEVDKLTGDTETDAAIIVAPRLTTRLISEAAAVPVGEDVWSDTKIELPPALQDRRWRCALTHQLIGASVERRLAVSELLGRFPVSLLLAASE